MRRIAWLSLLATCNLAVCFAGESTGAEAARTCAAISDAEARLACYDDIFKDVSPNAQTAREKTESKPAAKPQPTPTAEPELDAEERFGMRGDVARDMLDRQAAQTPKLDELRAKIVAIDWLPRGEFVVTLDNGQVWTQKRKESIGPLKVGDTVTIRAAALGSYRMTASTSRATRVQRTK